MRRLTFREAFVMALGRAILGWLAILLLAAPFGFLVLFLFPPFVVLLIVSGVAAALLVTAASEAGSAGAAS
jgi:hypothetical protein